MTLVVINTYVGEVSKVVDADSVKKDEEPYIEIAGLTGNGGKFETNASLMRMMWCSTPWPTATSRP